MNYKALIFLFIFIFGISLSFAQLVNGDYRSNSSGNWSTAGTWYKYNGSVWAVATTAPTAANNVYIQTGHTVTLTQAEACKNLHINVAGRVALDSYALSLNGILRAFSGAINVLPGTNSTSISQIPLTCTSSSGMLNVVGGTRTLTTSGQWGSGTFTASSSLFHMEINANTGATISIKTNVRAQSWNIVSGIFDIGTVSIEADNGVANAGDVTVGVDATVQNSSTAINSIFRRSSTLKGGTLTMDGLLKIYSLSSYGSAKVSMSTLSFNGTVEYAGAGDQYFLSAGSDTPANPNLFNHVILSGSGSRSLLENITVDGIFTRHNTASLVLNGFTLTYGTATTVEYSGTEAVTTADSEFPVVSGPANMIINNSGDVTIHSNSAITETLTFVTGSVVLSDFSFTVDNPVVGTSSYVYNGTGYITGAGLGTESNVIVRENTSTIIPDSLNLLTVQSGDEFPANLPDNTAVNDVVFASGSLGFNSKLLTLRNKDFAITGPNIITALTVDLAVTSSVVNGDTSIPHIWTTSSAFPNTVDIYLYYPDTYSSSSQMRAWKRRTTDAPLGWTNVGVYASTHYAPYRLVIIPNVSTLNDEFGSTLDWTLSETDQVLPVELSSFTAVLSQQTYITLQWVTQSETNVIGYNVFRSNQNDLTSAVQVNANVLNATNTSVEHTYYFRDVIVTSDNAYYYWLQDVSTDGTVNFHGSIKVELNNNGGVTPPPSIPLVTSIKNIYPNPFRNTATINYGVAKQGMVSINVFNTKGQLVKALLSDVKDANNYHVGWDGKDMNGQTCSSGIYFIELRSGTVRSTIKTILMK